MEKHREEVCLAFIRYMLNPTLFKAPEMDDEDWKDLYRFSYRHAILGVVFEGVKRVQEHGVKPPRGVFKKWIVSSLKIEQENKLLNQTTVQVCQQLERDGFRCCVLKGQGNNLMYPNPFGRTPGDIDVWLSKTGNTKADVRTIIQYVRRHNPKGKTVYHHIDYGKFQDIEVEVHYRPSFMNAPVNNHRLQKWFTQQADAQYENRVLLPEATFAINVPTPEFNAVFQLAHIYSHLMNSGIGLRQVIDYYYVLRAVKDKQGIEATLRHLGLWKIAGAMMWVQHNILGLEEQYLIAEQDNRLGRVLGREIVCGGNFGKKNPKGSSMPTSETTPKWQRQVKKNVRRLRRDVRLVRYFPSECLSEPFFRLYHFFWRMVM